MNLLDQIHTFFVSQYGENMAIGQNQLDAMNHANSGQVSINYAKKLSEKHMTKKIRLLNPDGSLHGVYEIQFYNTSLACITIEEVQFQFYQLNALGYKIEKIEEVEEKRREFWVLKEALSSMPMDIAHKAYIHSAYVPTKVMLDKGYTHVVELKPGEKILSREQIYRTWNDVMALHLGDSDSRFNLFAKELGFEE